MMTKPTAISLPTQFAGPASTEALFGPRRNVTAWDQAVGIARAMNTRVRAGDDTPGKNIQDRDTIAGLVGPTIPAEIERIIRDGL